MDSVRHALVIAAHPDDEVLGVGGTIPLIVRRGGDVTILLLTDGSTSQYPDDDRAVAEKREQARTAASRLGSSSLIHWDYPDMRLDEVSHPELNRAISAVIDERGVDTVFVHHRGDVNRDHREAHESTLVAARPTPDSPVRRILAYEVNSSTEWGSRSVPGFQPNVYVDISTTLELKTHALAAYPGELREHPHPRSIEAVTDRARVRGSEVGLVYAEAFELLLWRGSPWLSVPGIGGEGADLP
jgi:LmbE family N-acetylglucosaminyl deacetylase